MPMNNGNMPNTDGRGNGTRRTVRPDGSPLGNGAYQSGGARGNTAHTDGADRRRTAHKLTDARLRENGARRNTGKTERTGTARSRAGNDVGQNGARRRPENSRVGGANRRTDNAAPAQYYRRSAYLGKSTTARPPSQRTASRRKTVPPEKRPILSEGKIDLNALRAKVKSFVSSAFSNIVLERETLIKAGICAALMILFTLLQTTIFSSLRPFGAVPDMMLSAVIAIAVSEGEKWGAVCGLISSLLISSVGTTGFSVIPLVYMLTGYISGLLSRYYLRQNAVIRLLYQLCAGFLRAAATLMMLHAHMAHFTFTEVLTGTLLPEYFSTLAVSPLVQAAVWISLKAFHRTRAERTDTPSDL